MPIPTWLQSIDYAASPYILPPAPPGRTIGVQEYDRTKDEHVTRVSGVGGTQSSRIVGVEE